MEFTLRALRAELQIEHKRLLEQSILDAIAELAAIKVWESLTSQSYQVDYQNLLDLSREMIKK